MSFQSLSFGGMFVVIGLADGRKLTGNEGRQTEDDTQQRFTERFNVGFISWLIYKTHDSPFKEHSTDSAL